MITPAQVLEAYGRAAHRPEMEVLLETADVITAAWSERSLGGSQSETAEGVHLYRAIFEGLAAQESRVAAWLVVEVFRRLQVSGRGPSFHRALYMRLADFYGTDVEEVPS